MASHANDLNDLYGDQDDEMKESSDKPAQPQEIKRESASENEEDDSDSDIEFVIAAKPGQKAEAPSKGLPYAAIKIQRPGTETSSTATIKKEPVAKLPDVDINAIAELDGKSILEVDLEAMEKKPWRQPGADITEFFNYGFDEFTWTAYCQKQTSLRSEYTPDKVMAGMMNPMMGMGMRKSLECFASLISSWYDGS